MADMKKKFSFDIFQLLGAGFVVVWGIDFIAKALWHGISSFVFMAFCSFLLLVAGLGFLYKKQALIISALSMVIIFQLSWTVDTVGIVFTGKSYLHASEYLFGVGPLEYLVAMRHFFTLPALLYGLSKFSVNAVSRKAVLATTVIYLICMGIPFFLGPVAENINYTNMRQFPFDGTVLVNPNPARFFISFIILWGMLATLTYFLSKIPLSDEKWKRFLVRFSAWFTLFGILFSVLGYLRIY
jgi:hypothetical protein